MSNKEKLQLNNEKIQEMINLANSLPVYEDLNPELATQDDLITQIATALEGKTGASAPQKVIVKEVV